MREETEVKMKMKTKTQILAAHVMSLMHETGVTGVAFAADVRGHYEASYEEHAQVIDFNHAKDLYSRMTRDAETIKRWLDGTSRMPVDIEDSIIAAFPEDRRFDLLTDIYGAQGMLPVPVPNGELVNGEVAGKVLKEVGEAMIAYSNWESEQKKDQSLGDLHREIDEAIAVLASMRIKASLGGK